MRLSKYVLLFCMLLFVFGISGVAYAVPQIRTPAVCPATLIQGAVGVPYTFTFIGTGGDKIPPWSIIAGSPPPGVSLSGTGVLSGTPVALGTYTFTVELAAKNGQTATCVCTLTVVPATCSFVGGISSGTILFSPNIDPSQSSPVYGTVNQQVSFTCSANPIAYTVAVAPLSGWTLQSGSNILPFTPGIAGSGTYTGVAVNLLVPSGAGATSVLPTDYNNAPAGLYGNASAITITVSFSGLAPSIVATLPINSITGTVINMCSVAQAPGTLTFVIDPSLAGPIPGTISPDMQIKCTMNGLASISASSFYGGTTPKVQCTTAGTCGVTQIPYTFKILNSSTWPVTITGTGFGGVGLPMQLGGSVTSADYINAPIGTYGDTETITISY